MERAEKKNDRFEHKTEQDPTIVYGKNAVTELLKAVRPWIPCSYRIP